MVLFIRYILGKTAKERQYSWNNAPVETKIEQSLRRGIEVLVSWYEYCESGRLVPLATEVKHFFKNIKDYVGTTKIIEQPSHEELKVKSTQLIFLNQGLLDLLGIHFTGKYTQL